MKKSILVLAVAFITTVSAGARAGEVDPVIRNVVDHLKQDVVIMKQFGAHQRVVTTKLTQHGKPQRVEEKTLRTVWVNNKPTNQLVNIQCKEYDPKSGKGRRCYDVEQAAYKKAAQKKDSKPGKIERELEKISWVDLHKNFDFALLPPEGPYHVISFRPSANQTSPQNRIEKLLSRMQGKIWVDSQFKVVKAEAALANTVSFGWGVAAKVHQLSLRYQQQAYQGVWLPASLTAEFRAKIALVHTERQRIEVFWTGPYRQSDTVWAQANTAPISKTSVRR